MSYVIIYDMQLEPEQKYVIKELLSFKKPVIKLGGFAGSGKSTVIAHLIRALPNFSVCAFTGKAANVLRKKGLPATTIHSLIYAPQRDNSGNIILDKNGNPIFILSPDIQCEGIIVDEASMVSHEIYQDLTSFNLPIIFVGDHGQLEPVNSDFNLMKEPDLKLEKIHRNAGEIARFAEFIRKGHIPSAFGRRFSTKDIYFISRNQMDNYLLEVDQIICAFNKSRVEINDKVRKKLNYKDTLVAGERIMCLRNNAPIGLFNGMQGVVEKIKKKNKIIFNSDNESFIVSYDSYQFGQERYEIDRDRDAPNPFDYAYCITAHKSQGDEWESVMVKEEICNKWNHVRWAYTSASRAKKKLIWVT